MLISRLQVGVGLKGNLSQKSSFFFEKMSNCAHVIDISVVVKKGALNRFCVAAQVHLAILAVVKSERSR